MKKVGKYFLVYAWIDAATTTLLRDSPLLCSLDKINSILENIEPDWKISKGKTLAERLDRLVIEIIKKEDTRAALTKEWLKRLVNFLMPEVSGIGKDSVKCFGEKINRKETELVKFWNDCKNDVTRFRTDIFKHLEGMDMEEKFRHKLNTEGLEYAKEMGIKLNDPFEASSK